MFWSNFSDCFLFQEWISLWRSCVLRCYNFETTPHRCQTCPLAGPFLSPGGGWTSHFLCYFSQFVPLSFTLALPFSWFWIFDPAALRIILFAFFSPPVKLWDSSLSYSVLATGDCGTTSIAGLCSVCLTWKPHINTWLFLLLMDLLNSFSWQCRFFKCNILIAA